MEKKEIISWLVNYIGEYFDGINVEIWLFGSMISNKPFFNDCDILIVYVKEYLPAIIENMEQLKNDFKIMFEIYLHITALTRDEFQEKHFFLESIFQSSIYKIL